MFVGSTDPPEKARVSVPAEPASAKSSFLVSQIFLLAEEGDGVSAETALSGTWS